MFVCLFSILCELSFSEVEISENRTFNRASFLRLLLLKGVWIEVNSRQNVKRAEYKILGKK